MFTVASANRSTSLSRHFNANDQECSGSFILTDKTEAGYFLECCNQCRKDRIVIPQRQFIAPHMNGKKVCRGEFKFDKGLLDRYQERTCKVCGCKEMYEDSLIVVARPGVRSEIVQELCLSILKMVWAEVAGKDVGPASFLKIVRDRSNPERVAAILNIHGVHNVTEPAAYLENLVNKVRIMPHAKARNDFELLPFQAIVAEVYRKPHTQ